MNEIDIEYKHAIRTVLDTGIESQPRDKKTKELINYNMRLDDSAQCVLLNRNRKPNYAFMIAEWLWIMFGRKDVYFVDAFNPNIGKFSDNGFDYFGAYGPHFEKQIEYVYNTLANDHDSRQAVMSIWQQNPPKTKDVPCTLTFQFLVRYNKLCMIANMRSNDVFLGVPYDTFNFCQIGNLVASMLGIDRGPYILNAGSFHLYEPHYQKARDVCFENDPDVVRTKKIDYNVESGMQHYLAMKEHFNNVAHLIVKGELSDEDTMVFPFGIFEHVNFLNHYAKKDGSHKYTDFWKGIYEYKLNGGIYGLD